MTGLLQPGLDAFRAGLSGTVIVPGDADYDEARSRCNGDVDRRPAVIVRCASAGDVAAALAFAREGELGVAVCGGGHSSAGTSVADGALVIDLRPMRRVVVDPEALRVRCQGGARLADLDAATQEHGLAVPSGMISETGVGGLTLGGGMGWLTRMAGLTIDNLVSAEVVTADGRVVRAAADEHPELFWALRGAGGNVGVVTEFEFALHPVGRLAQFAMLFFDLGDGPALLRAVRELMPGLGRDLGVAVVAINAPPAPFVPAELHFRPGYGLIVNGFGDPAGHADALARARAATPPRLFEFETTMPYGVLQSFQDASLPWGTPYYDSSVFLPDLTEDVVATIAGHVPGKPTPQSQVVIYTVDGAYNEVADADTAFGGDRSARFVLFAIGVGADRDGVPAARGWVRGMVDALRPASASASGYVNALGADEMDDARAVYGPKLARLAAVKAEWDPGNVFCRNAGVAPP